MLKLILSGALGADAEVKEIGNSKLVTFNVAVSMDYKDQKGNKVEKTEWVRANIWKSKDQSTKVADYLKKGTKVLIDGVPESDAYKSKEGDIKSYLSVKVKDLEFLG